MSRILKAYDKSVFKISEHFIKVVFPFKEDAIDTNTKSATNSTTNSATNATDCATIRLTKDEMKVIDLIRSNPEVTQAQLHEITGITLGTIKRILPRLQEKGKIERIGNRRSGKWHITF